MKYTNKLNLPQALVSAVENHGYSRGKSRISVTQLINAPKIVCLQEKCWDDIEVDVVDQMFSLFGQSVHSILERVKTNCIKEKRYYYKHKPTGWTVSGQVDLLADNILDDYKLTSVYKVQKGLDDGWIQQLNLNAFLARMNGEKIDKVRIVSLMRDWSVGQVKRGAWNYPKHPVKILEAPLWTEEEQYKFLTERLELHKEAVDTGVLPDCTDEERWANPSKFRIIKGKNKRATKACDTYIEAVKWVEEQDKPKQYKIVESPKTYNRCADYCSVNRWCHQYLDTLEKEKEENEL